MKIIKLTFLLALTCLYSFSIYSQQNQQHTNKFLLVLDIQEYYTGSKLSDTETVNFIDNVNYIIENTDVEKVIYIKSNHKVLNMALSKPFIYVSNDTAAMHFDKNLKIVNDNIFTKDEGDAFSVDDLNIFLEKNNAKEIVIVGLLAEECIYKTSLGGLENNYDIFIVPQAILGKSEKSKNKKIEKLREKGVNVIDISYF